MSKDVSCPPVTELQRFLLGRCTDAELDRIEQHLVHCGRCPELLQTLKAEDTLIEALRGRGDAVLESDNDFLKGRIERLCQLYPTRVEPSTGSERPPSASAAEDGGQWCDFLAAPQGPDEIGRLGPYQIHKVLGAGGMGVVFQAEDPGLKRLVALKVLKPALAASESARQRFLREAPAAAAVKHDHIVTVHQVGQEGSVPFLAMEFLTGQTLDERVQGGRRLEVAAIVRIGRETAEGLAAAHRQGLIHRDIKPSNLWLEPLPTLGSAAEAPRERVKILDFGLARPASEEIHLTQEGAILGTPGYMAPEQAQGQAVDARCDLFSLGCVLYRLATGELPFQGATAMAVLMAVTLETPQPPGELNAELPPRLNELIVRLLAKDPNERPASALAVAEELRGLEQTVSDASQKRPAAPRRPRRWSSAVAAALLLAVGGALLTAIVIRIQHPDGKETEISAPEGSHIAIDDNGKVTVTLPKEKAKPKVRPKPPTGMIAPEPLDLASGAPLMPTALVSRPAPIEGLRSWAMELAQTDAISALALSPDGKLLAGAGMDGTVRVWDTERGQLLHLLLGHLPMIHDLVWSPEGRYLASAGSDKTVRVWDVLSGRLARTLKGPDAQFRAVVWAPDGQRIVSAGDDRSIRIWEAKSGKQLQALSGHVAQIMGLRWSPDGKMLASCGLDNSVRLWDAATGKQMRKLGGHKSAVNRVIWSPDSQRLATVGNDALVHLWDAGTGKKLVSYGRHSGVPASVAWSTDGKRLASGGSDTALQTWDAETGKFLQTFASQPVTSLGWSRDGKTLIAGSNTGWVQFFDAETGTLRRAIPPRLRRDASRAAWSPKGDRIACRYHDGTITLWWADSGQPAGSLQSPKTVLDVAWSPDGTRLAAPANAGRVFIWEVDSRQLLQTLVGHDRADIGAAAWSPDGKLLATASSDQSVRLWDVESGKSLHVLRKHTAAVTGVAWSPDGRFVASCGGDGLVLVWSVEAGELRQRVDSTGRSLSRIAWSPDGKALAVSGARTRLVDVASGKEFEVLNYGGYSHDVAWSPDGKTVAAAGDKGSVCLWDAHTGRLLQRLVGSATHIVSASWSPDGKTLLSFDSGGALKLWDAASGQLRATLLASPYEQYLSISPEGHYRGSPGIERQLVCVAAANDGTETLRPAEFARQYGWTNDPSRVQPLGRPPERLIEVRQDVALDVKPGAPLSALSLAPRPSELKGVRSWSIETRLPRAGINVAEYSPDGRWLATGEGSGAIRLWHASTGILDRAFLGHAGRVAALAWSPDSKALASASSDHSVRIWESTTGRLRRLLRGHDREVRSVAWSPDGRTLASSSDKVVFLWDASSGQLRDVLQGNPALIVKVAWSPDSRTLACAGHDRAVRLWDADIGQMVGSLTGHTDVVVSVCWSPDGKTLASGSNDRTVCLWEARSGKLLRTLQEHSGPVTGVGWSPDGRWLASIGHGMTALWDATSGKLVSKSSAPSSSGSGLSWAPDSRAIAFAPWEWRVQRTDVPAWQPRSFLGDVATHGGFAALSPDGKLVAVTDDWRYSVQLWNTDTGQRTRMLQMDGGYWLSRLTWSPDGTMLASAMTDGRIRLWQPDPGKLLHSVQGATSYITGVAWSPDGKRCAFSGPHNGAVQVWDAAAGKPLFTAEGAGKSAEALDWSPDGTQLAYSSRDDKVVRICGARTGKLLRSLTNVGSSCLAYSPDGQLLAIAYNGVVIRDARTDAVVLQFPTPPSPPYQLTWSPDGKWLLGALPDGTVRTWEVATGRPRYTLCGDSSHVGSLAWSRDGRTLVSACGHDSVRFWDAATGQPLSAVLALGEGRWLSIMADGHYRGSVQIERQLVVVVLKDSGEQETLTMAEFAKKYGWKNDPERVRLTAK